MSRLTALPRWPLALPAVWVFAVAVNALGLDFVVPPLVLAGTASLLPGGRGLLDRLMLALALLFGVCCAAGLVLSLWPWHLAPLPLTGLALSTLVCVARFGHRRPRLPLPDTCELGALGAAVVVTGYLGGPYLRADLAGRVSLAMGGEDLVRHLTIFDGIGQVGGYLFLHPHAAGQYVYSGMIRYPQGSHFVAALVDAFLPHPHPGGAEAFDHFVGFHLFGYGLMTLSLLWAALWIGGRRLAEGWRWLPVVALLALLCAYSDLVADFAHGYPSEIAGIALMAQLTAVLARPLAAHRTQILLIAALLVALGFTYYLFLPGMALATLLWLAARRFRVPHRRFTVAVLATAGALALLPVAVGVFGGGQLGALNSPTSNRASRDTFAAIALVVAAVAATRAARGSPLWRGYRWPVLGMAGYIAVLGGYQRVVFGDTGYYFEKALHATQVVLTLGVGAVAALLPPPSRSPALLAASLRARLTAPLAPLLAAAAVSAALGLPVGDAPYHPVPGLTANWGRAWLSGSLTLRHLGAVSTMVAERYPPPPGGATVLLTDDPYTNYAVSLFVAALQRNAGAPISRAFYRGSIPGTSPTAISDLLTAMRAPARVVTNSPKIMAVVYQLRREHPELRLSLVDLTGGA